MHWTTKAHQCMTPSITYSKYPPPLLYKKNPNQDLVVQTVAITLSKGSLI